MIVYEIFTVLIAIICSIKALLKIEEFLPIIAVLIVFDFTMVLPLAIELFMGIPQMGYYGYKLALNDDTTTLIYCFFVCIAELVFLKECFLFV